METNRIGIYKITNIINNKVYIGQSQDMDTRLRGHKSTLKANTHFNIHLQRAYNKYGIDSFTYETQEECSEDIINERESYWIEFYNSMDRFCGYNIDYGGKKNAMSDEHKLNMSIAKNGVHRETPLIYITYSEITEILKQSNKNEKLLLYAMLVYSKRYADDNGIFYMSYKQMSIETGIKGRITLLKIVNKFDTTGVIERIIKDFNKTKEVNSFKININMIADDNMFLVDKKDNCRESFNNCLLAWFDNKYIKNLCGRRHYEGIMRYEIAK